MDGEEHSGVVICPWAGIRGRGDLSVLIQNRGEKHSPSHHPMESSAGKWAPRPKRSGKEHTIAPLRNV